LFRWLPIITSWKKLMVRWLPIMTSWRKDKQSWILSQARTHSWQWLLKNLSVSCRMNQFLFCNYSYVVHTEYIYIYIFQSTEHCAWAIISPERVQILCHAHIICITVLENRIVCCQIFCDLLLKSAFERIFNVMQLILGKIQWHIIKVKIFNPKIPRYLPFILL
jgi:hypothetical protein